jgi:hypothetical protein
MVPRRPLLHGVRHELVLSPKPMIKLSIHTERKFCQEQVFFLIEEGNSLSHPESSVKKPVKRRYISLHSFSNQVAGHVIVRIFIRNFFLFF